MVKHSLHICEIGDAILASALRIRLLVWFLLPWAANAEVIEDLSYKWYSVFHKSGTSLSKALTLSTPIRDDGKKYRGYTRWNIKWQFETQVDPDGWCRISANIINLTAVITIPGLVSSEEKAKAQFSRYITNLKVHEMGHVDIARKAAADIDEVVLELPAMNSCTELSNVANQLGQARLQRARNEGEQYDAITKNGKTQGAFLN